MEHDSKTVNTAPDITATDVAGHASEAKPAPKKGKKTDSAPPQTRGEKIFNVTDWWGIGWLANMLSSLWLADKATKLEWQPRLNWLTNKVVKQPGLRSGDAVEGSEYVQKFNRIAKELLTHHGIPQVEEVKDGVGIKWDTKTLEASGVEAEEGFRGLFNRIGKAADVHAFVQNHETLKSEFAENSVKDIERIMKAGFRYHTALGKAKSVAALMMLCGGGYLVMAPVKWLEDRKKDIVCWLDNHIGPKNPDEKTKEQIEARHEYLAHEPKQTWTSVFLSRTAVMPLIYTVHFNLGSRDNIVNRIGYKLGEEKRLFEGLDNVSNTLGNKAYQYAISKPNTAAWVEKKELELGEHIQQNEAVIEAKANNGHKFSQEVVRDGLYSTAGKPTDDPTTRLRKNGHSRMQGVFNNLFLESIYSFSVATTTFLFSRVFAPIFGQKSDEDVTLERMNQKKELEKALERCPLPVPANDEKLVSEASVEIANKVIDDNGNTVRHLPANKNTRDANLPPTHIINSAQRMDVLQQAESQQIS